MRAYQIAAASMALCAGLLFTSYLKAAEVDLSGQSAQMNRANYARMAEGDAQPVYVPPRRPHNERRADVAQMNCGHYAKAEPVLLMPRRPDDQRQYIPVVAQSNRAIYGR